MPLTCKYDGCNGATKLVDDNGATDSREDRLERYECEYGHDFSVLLDGVK